MDKIYPEGESGDFEFTLNQEQGSSGHSAQQQSYGQQAFSQPQYGSQHLGYNQQQPNRQEELSQYEHYRPKQASPTSKSFRKMPLSKKRFKPPPPKHPPPPRLLAARQGSQPKQPPPLTAQTPTQPPPPKQLPPPPQQPPPPKQQPIVQPPAAKPPPTVQGPAVIPQKGVEPRQPPPGIQPTAVDLAKHGQGSLQREEKEEYSSSYSLPQNVYSQQGDDEWETGYEGEGQSSFEWSFDDNRIPSMRDFQRSGSAQKRTSGWPRLSINAAMAVPLQLFKKNPGRTAKSVLALFAIIALGYLVYETARVPEYTCPTAPGRIEVEARSIELRASGSNDVCVLKAKSGINLGRSFDGSVWEESSTSIAKFSCNKKHSCRVNLPSSGTYYLEKYGSVKSATIQRSNEVARFLIQATFGPKQSDLDRFGTKTFKAWILDQTKLTPTLHREYFRRRANPRTQLPAYPGRPKHPCESMSRWHRHAFTPGDVGKVMEVINSPAGFVTVKIDGIDRTRIPLGLWNAARPTGDAKICSVRDLLGGPVSFGNGCRSHLPNLAIDLPSLPAGRTLTVGGGATLESMAAPVPGVRILKTPEGVDRLRGCSVPGFGPVFTRANGIVFQHERRLHLIDNTLESPASGYQLNHCPRAPKTFLNKKYCVVGGKGCNPKKYRRRQIQWTLAAIGAFHRLSGLYVYRLVNLRLDRVGNPCQTRKSRWMRVPDCALSPGLDDITQDLIIHLIEAAVGDPIRDINIPAGSHCNGVNLKGATVEAGGLCYRHVHPDELNIYDFTRWALLGAHPGNVDQLNKANVNAITKFVEQLGSLDLRYPVGHPMVRWDTASRDVIKLLGVFGGFSDFADLPPEVQTDEVASFLGSEAIPSREDALEERCGSPGEVANDPNLGNRFPFAQTRQDEVQFITRNSVDMLINTDNIKTSVWTMIALNARDQLRQRMAFALAQILVVTIAQVPGFEDEIYINYYDIFVRNAFGNYLDVLREVSFSPMMAAMLTYEETKSIDYSFQRTGQEIYPDENYAREIMQLFTVGLLRLNNDGSVQKSPSGRGLETYTNDDILAFARVWTGFKRRPARGNFEAKRVVDPLNYLDPMQIIPEWRDPFPKMNLYRGHLGDGFPLCSDLPNRMFLLKGARWSYLGTSISPKLQKDPAFPDPSNTLVLEANSALFRVLCNGPRMDCKYRSEFILPSNLHCKGKECEILTARVVKVKDAYYEYVRPACTSFVFFEKGAKIMKQSSRQAMCAERQAIAAATACCSRESLAASKLCHYNGERVDLATATRRCAVQGLRICDFNGVDERCNPGGYFWSSSSCTVKLRVRRDGQVSPVHYPEGSGASVQFISQSVADGNKNFFRVDWVGGLTNAPTVANKCLGGLCTIHNNEFCLCSITIEESTVFSEMPTRDQVLRELHIGSMDPKIYQRNPYHQFKTEAGVSMHTTDALAPFKATTIFEVLVNGKKKYFRNKRSMVRISPTVGFRNAVSFVSLSEPTVRDAEYETEAFLDHLVHHPNTPPFIAYRIIQRFVTSNPSPRYVDAVATAFSQGFYQGFGTRNYGDLAATIAAVLLDKEARNTALDSDPAFGQLREPVIKLMHVMRSLQAEASPGKQIEPNLLDVLIAEEPHRAPNVFNYFRPEYAPPGPVANAKLVAPEAMVFTTPRIVSYINGMVSTVKYGLGNCFGGFTTNHDGPSCAGLRRNTVHRQHRAHAKLTWMPSNGINALKEDVVQELDVLLTAGRLAPSAKELLYKAYEYAYRTASSLDQRPIEGIVAVQQLLVTSPEFQITNLVQRQAGKRRATAVSRNGTAPYKAVVYLFLKGGCDSFNLVVPHSNCKNGKDMFQEYTQVRTDLALPKGGLHQISVQKGSQVCETFGVHSDLPIVKELYNQREAMFLANVGVLAEPITKHELLNGLKEVPESLFAHNIQQQSAQTLRPQDRGTVGVLGRAQDVLWEEGHSTGSFSIASGNFILEPHGLISPAQFFVGQRGFTPFNPSQHRDDRIDETMFQMSQNVSKSLYGETWSSLFETAFNDSKTLWNLLNDQTLEAKWTANGELGLQLQQVATLIKARGELGHDRQAFYVDVHGFDTHSNNGFVLSQKFREINSALESFVKEMRLQGVWDDVVILQSSDFSRTITSNGAGTDHGWGGHYMLFGGGIQGGRMLGVYPDDLTSSGELNIGRGRFIPSVSWDSVWNAVARWYGVPKKRMEEVIPHIHKYQRKDLFEPSDLFTNAASDTNDDKEKKSVFIALLSVVSAALAMMLGGIGFVVYKRRGQIKSDFKKSANRLSRRMPYKVQSVRTGNTWQQTGSNIPQYYNQQRQYYGQHQ